MRRLWRNTPMGVKAALAVFAILSLVSLAQALSIFFAFGPVLGPPSPRVHAFFLVPAFVGAAFSGTVMAVMARRRVRRFVEALDRITKGDLDTRLPPAPDRELEVVQNAFATMADALSKAQRRLAHADQQRRRLFADLAHELATPASAVLGIADTLARPELCPTPETRAHQLENLEREATRLTRLVADVRELANLDDPDLGFERVDTDLAALAERIAATYQARCERPNEPVMVPVDPIRVEQVLVNLLRNARRYTTDGTVVVGMLTSSDHVVLSVEDSGPGVPDDVLERLGERLFRVDPSRDRRTGGHGLGLAIVRSIVARHDGSVAFARSSLGGLAVHVTLPR